MIDKSSRVRAADFETYWLKNRAKEIGLDPSRLHRKTWELAIIAQVFGEQMVYKWRKGEPNPPKCLGFGCGKEPLPLWLYNEGADVTATDYPGDNPAWTKTNQHASSLEDLGFGGFLDPLRQRISFRPVDMNDIPDDLLQGQFDFTWSCGSFEHIGGIQQSLSFFCRQMECLRQGGIACHTTEFNYESLEPWCRDFETLNDPNLCLFRYKDLMTLAGWLWAQGDQLFPPDLDDHKTFHPADLYVDEPPYYQDPDRPYHLNIRIGSTKFKTTSICLIARRG